MEHSPLIFTEYQIWYFTELTFQADADVCIWGLLDAGVGPQHSFWTRGGPALPSETPANSGKSAIFTSNGTKLVCAGFDLPAEFGADLASLKPEDQLQKLTAKVCYKPIFSNWSVGNQMTSSPKSLEKNYMISGRYFFGEKKKTQKISSFGWHSW